MSKWQNIKSAPKNGTLVCLKFDDGKVIKASFQGGLLDSDWKDCGGWHAHDYDAPTCWTNGVCWEVNEDDVQSKQPTHWQPITPQPGDTP